MKTIIFIVLLIIASPKIEEQFGKEIPFSFPGTSFDLTFPENGVLFISIKFATSKALRLSLKFKNHDKEVIVESPGYAAAIPYEKYYNNKIVLEYESISYSNEKGIFWMNPSSDEIKVNLSEIYEWKYDFQRSYATDELNTAKHYVELLKTSPLLYTIDDAEKDVILEFDYNDKFIVEDNLTITNPMMIWDKDGIRSELTTYEIKKGDSLKIYMSIICTPKKTCYLPSFKFYFVYDGEIVPPDEEELEEIEKEQGNINNSQAKEKNPLSKLLICLIAAIIVLMIGIIVCIILIIRGNKGNNEKNIKDGIQQKNSLPSEENVSDNIEDTNINN